jgi:hypothetical protein
MAIISLVALRDRSSAASVVHAVPVLLLVLLLLCSMCLSHAAAHAGDGKELSVAAAGTAARRQDPTASSSSNQQTSVLNRLWWRNLEEEDTFIQSLFRKPLAFANIGMITGAVAGDSTAASGAPQHQQLTRGKIIRTRGIVHHAPANSTGPEKRLFIPRLHLVYTLTEKKKRALESQAASVHAATTAAQHLSAASISGTYTQLLRSVLPLSFGWSTEMEVKPLTPLQTAALHSPIAPLRAFVLNQTATAAPYEQHTAGVGAARTATHNGAVPVVRMNEDDAEHAVRVETQMAAEEDTAPTKKASFSVPDEGEGSQNDEVPTSELGTANKTTSNTANSVHGLYGARNFADEVLVIVDSDTKAVVPLTITGTSYTVVQFDGKAGNTINAVVQLKDHRYDHSVSPSNCMNMYLRVELRNHLKTGGGDGSGSSSSDDDSISNVHASTQPHPYIDKNQWSRVTGRTPVTTLGDMGDSSNSDNDPDISTASRGSWASFWDSFALMFDTSALCKVLPSVSMRVSKAPHTEPFYVVLRSTTRYSYETAYYYNTTSGSFYANTMDDDYNCELDLYIEQWPAAEQERLHFIFAFVIPLLVLLLPLPFTMRRADLVQQYMMETDYAEWVWRPPYFLRNRMMEGLRALASGVMRLYSAYQQRALLSQMLHAQQQQQQQEEPQPRPAHSGVNGGDAISDSHGTHKTDDRGGRETASDMPRQPLTPPVAATPSTATTTQRPTAATAGAAEGDGSERGASPLPPHGFVGADAPSRPSHKGEQTLQLSRTPRRQFKESASAASSPSHAASRSYCSSSSSGSSTVSDVDDVVDGRCQRALHRATLDRESNNNGGDQRSPHPGAVSPPRNSCAPDALLYVGDVAMAAAAAAATSPIATSSPSLVSQAELSSRSSHHRHHYRHGANHDSASCAVSVHVPLSLESPVVSNPRGSSRCNNNNNGGGGVHATAHDLLFTTAEATGGELRTASPGKQLTQATSPLQQPSREDAEAACTACGAADGTVIGSVTAEQSKSASQAKNGQEGAVGVGKGIEDDTEEPFCRICREGNDVAPLITPCGCTGSVRFVHATCLDRWRLESAKRNLANVNHCEICKMPFTVNIQRSTLVRQSLQHILRGACLFLACVLAVVLTTTLTHGILGELSCLASYHEVAYGTMFRFEGLSISLFVYGLAVLLVLFANLIVFSWFRSRPEVEEYVEEMHAVPPFYTRRNMILIVLVSLLLLAQVHATGFLLKYFLYKTSHLVWSWETSPLVGGMLFALFTTCSITICSWGRQMYMLHVVNRGAGQHPAEDVVVENIGNNDNWEAPVAAPPAPVHDFMIPTSTTLNYHTPQASANPQANSSGNDQTNTAAGAPRLEVNQNREVNPASPLSQAPIHLPPTSPAPVLRTVESPQPADEDVSYTRHFEVPPEQRVIRAFEYCPPRRRVPK